MKSYFNFACAVAAAALLIGCAGSKEMQHAEGLRRHPDWPRIRAAAEL